MTLILAQIENSFDVRYWVRVCLLAVIMKATILIQTENVSLLF